MRAVGVSVGDTVVASTRILEILPDGHAIVHAKPGCLGIVRAVDGDWVTVTWGCTRCPKTTTDTHRSEFVRDDDARPAPEVEPCRA